MASHEPSLDYCEKGHSTVSLQVECLHAWLLLLMDASLLHSADSVTAPVPATRQACHAVVDLYQGSQVPTQQQKGGRSVYTPHTWTVVSRALIGRINKLGHHSMSHVNGVSTCCLNKLNCVEGTQDEPVEPSVLGIRSQCRYIFQIPCLD